VLQEDRSGEGCGQRGATPKGQEGSMMDLKEFVNQLAEVQETD